MEDPAPPPDRRKLTVFDATLLVMGGIVGIGIFFTPQEVAAATGVPWAFLAVWIFGGAIAMCAALTFAELGGTWPRSGGWFVFLREAFGPFSAFLFAWVVLGVISTGAMAIITGFCATQLHHALPAWIGEEGTASHAACAIGILVTLTVITMAGVKRAALLQNLCMILKLVVLAGLVLAGLILFTPADAAEPTAEVARVVTDRSVVRGMLAALLPVFFSYGGWQLLCYIAPEVKDPERTLPRAIVIGVIGTIVIYLLANLAYLRVLGIDVLASDPDFAARMARESLGPMGERLLSGGMAISGLGVLAVNVITGPWLYVAMAREKLFFQSVGRLSPNTGVPVNALAIQAGLATVYFFVSTLGVLINAVVFVEWIFHGLAALALLRLRFTRPSLPRPFTSWAYPLAPIVYLIAALLVVGHTLIDADLEVRLRGLGVLAVGVAIYRPWRAVMRRTP